MNCLVCEKPLDGFTPLCGEHAPAWGESLSCYNLTIFVGELNLFSALLVRIMGRKLIRWWVGSDVLLLHEFPPGRGKLSVFRHRLLYHLTKLFVTENWITAERLRDEFEACGGKKAFVRYHIEGMLMKKVVKIKHEGVNVAWYVTNSSKSARWKYGVDLVEELMLRFYDVNWIKLDGTLDMREVFPYLDAYIRPSRHDGRPRLVIECQTQGIPYYWSENGEPDLDEMFEFVKKIVDEKNGILQ